MFRTTLFLMAILTAGITFGQERMTPELLWDIKRIGTIQISPDNTKILFSISEYDLKVNKGSSDLYIIPVKGGEIKRVTNSPEGEYEAQWRPDGQKIGYMKQTVDGIEIFEINPDGTGEEKISDFKEDIGGFKYFPNGKKIVFIREVKLNKVNSAELYGDLDKSNARVYEDLMYRHWSTWEDGKRSHVFYAEIKDGQVVGEGKDIMEGEPFDCPLKPFGGMEQITVSTDSKTISYVCKKKTGLEYATSTNSEIYNYDLESGKTVNLTAGNMGYDMDPQYSGDGKKMAWLSMEKDGFEADKNDIIVYDLASGEKKNMTAKFDLTVSGFAWGRESKKIYFKSCIEATYQLFELDLGTGEMKQLTEGVHNYTSVAVAGFTLVGGRQSMNHPTDIYTVDVKTGKQTQLTDINKEIYDKIKVGDIESRWIETTDGKKELVWVIYPPDFDKNKKYPAILYCQGGPQSAVSQFFSYRWNFQLMAANDYIIVAPNRRGLPGFGQKWNDAISGDWGGQPMDDYLSAIDALKEEPFIDENRIGAIGASYGGYSVYYLAGIHEDRFKCFISHCGLYNLESWYGTTEELFFANEDIGGPYYGEELPEGYVKNSPHRYAHKWNTPMLIFHGEQDFRVPVNQGMEAFQACQIQGIESKLILFPDENHWVLSPQNGVFWHREFYAWLNKYLK